MNQFERKIIRKVINYNMKNTNKIWLIFEKSNETRISGSIDSYRDRTGEFYIYDNLVPNHKNIKEKDIVIIRKENEIIGVGIIDSIETSKSIKSHKRCKICNGTDIRKRIRKTPTWKCGKCKHEFQIPTTTETEVSYYKANISNFKKFETLISFQIIKACASKGNGMRSQLSIMELDRKRVVSTLGHLLPHLSKRENTYGQGFGLSYEEKKVVENRAMQITYELYKKNGWILTDTSKSKPYDFLAKKGKEIRYIEVKGTTGIGKSIILTKGEVDHAKKNSSALIIISNIKIIKSENTLVAQGGEITSHFAPWIINDNNLNATQYRYNIT